MHDSHFPTDLNFIISISLSNRFPPFSPSSHPQHRPRLVPKQYMLFPVYSNTQLLGYLSLHLTEDGKSCDQHLRIRTLTYAVRLPSCSALCSFLHPQFLPRPKEPDPLGWHYVRTKVRMKTTRCTPIRMQVCSRIRRRQILRPRRKLLSVTMEYWKCSSMAFCIRFRTVPMGRPRGMSTSKRRWSRELALAQITPYYTE